MKNIRAVALMLALVWPASVAAETKVVLLLQNRLGPDGQSVARSATSAIANALGQERRLALVRPEALERRGLSTDSPLSPDRAAALAQTLQAEVAVAGSLFVAAYQIEARLLATTTGALIGQETIKGSEHQIFDVVDVLGTRLASHLQNSGHTSFAVLPCINFAGDSYRLFVRGLADILSANLSQATGLNASERAEIDKGLTAFNPPLDDEDAIALGKWLGTDAVLVCSFAEILALEVQALESHTGTVLVTRRVEGPMREIPHLADEFGSKLAQSIAAVYKDIRKVAVLYFQNHADAQYDGFVQGIADMMMTSLGQSQQLKLTERVQIDKAVENFDLELSGAIDTETAVEVGTWLGADAVVLGSFTKFGELYRIDARLIDAETGELLLAQNVRGAKDEVIALVDQLGAKLIKRFDEEQRTVDIGIGTIVIHFRFTKSEMGERPAYHHICKLYVDNQYMGMSLVVSALDEEVKLFAKTLKAGPRQVRIVHGYVKDGAWDGEMPVQPVKFHIGVEPDGATTIRYAFETGWFEDKYIYYHRGEIPTASSLHVGP